MRASLCYNSKDGITKEALYVGNIYCPFYNGCRSQADLVTMAAPKPYFIGSSLLDFFPIEGTRETYVEVRRFYSMMGAEDNIEIYVAPKPHGFWHDTREKLLRFLCKHLNVDFIENKK